MSLEIIIQGIVAMLTTVGFIFQITSGLPKSRRKLRQDLEIFKMMNPNDEYFDLVRTKINKDIKSIYNLKEEIKDNELESAHKRGLIDWYKINYQRIDLVV